MKPYLIRLPTVDVQAVYQKIVIIKHSVRVGWGRNLDFEYIDEVIIEISLHVHAASELSSRFFLIDARNAACLDDLLLLIRIGPVRIFRRSFRYHDRQVGPARDDGSIHVVVHEHEILRQQPLDGLAVRILKVGLYLAVDLCRIAWLQFRIIPLFPFVYAFQNGFHVPVIRLHDRSFQLIQRWFQNEIYLVEATDADGLL